MTEPYALHVIKSVQDALDQLQHNAQLVLTPLFQLQLESSVLIPVLAFQIAFTVIVSVMVVVTTLLTALDAGTTKHSTMVETYVFRPVVLRNISIFCPLELQSVLHVILAAVGAMVLQPLTA